MNKPISNEQEKMWQRVLMGTACHDEEQTVLALCEIDPQKYRELALGLLQERQFSLAIANIAEEERRPVSQANTVFIAQSMAPLSTAPQRSWPLALAALMMGLLVGWYHDLWFSPSKDTPATLPANQPLNHTLASDGTNDITSQGEQLAADHVTSQEDFELAPLFDEEMKSSLQQAGFEINESPDVYFIRGRDGSRWYMPTQTTTVRFNGP